MTTAPPDLGGLFSLPAPPADDDTPVCRRAIDPVNLNPPGMEPWEAERFKSAVAPALARRSDPDTSRLAAAHAAANLPALQARALSWVRRRPGLTATEMAREAGEGDPRVFNRRLGELDRAGRVVRGAARRCRVTGRQAATWTAAE